MPQLQPSTFDHYLHWLWRCCLVCAWTACLRWAPGYVAGLCAAGRSRPKSALVPRWAVRFGSTEPSSHQVQQRQQSACKERESEAPLILSRRQTPLASRRPQVCLHALQLQQQPIDSTMISSVSQLALLSDRMAPSTSQQEASLRSACLANLPAGSERASEGACSLR